MAKTWQSMLAVLAVTSAALFTGAPPALAQDDGGGSGPDPTTASTAERVSAEVLPAVMYLQVDVRAWMRNLLTGDAFQAPARTFSCTGFAVGPNGTIATAGHCVDDEEVLVSVAETWAQEDAAAGYDYQQSLDFYKENYKLEGAIANSPPDRTVTVYRASDTGSRAGAGMLAQVVDHKGLYQGDVALLKVDATNLPTVEVAPSDGVNTGTAVMSVGYPSSRDAVVDPNLTPTWEDGTVSSRQNLSGVPFLEITSEIGRGMSGGPTVNERGQVVGINSWATANGGDTFNFVAPSSTLLEMMARNGLRSEAGPVDVAYRGGLDDYFAGQYSDAADEFQRVLDIQPDNKMASEYRVKAIAAYNQFGDKGSLGLVGWLLIGAGALVVVVAVFTVLLVRRSRKRRAPDATTAQAGTAQPQQSYAGPWPAGALIPTQRLGEEPTPTRSFGDWTAGPSSPAVGFPVPTPGRAESSTTGSDATASSRSAAPVATASPTLTESGDAGDAPTSEGVAVSPSMGFCPNCGTPRTSGARFCGSCGHQV